MGQSYSVIPDGAKGITGNEGVISQDQQRALQKIYLEMFRLHDKTMENLKWERDNPHQWSPRSRLDSIDKYLHDHNALQVKPRPVADYIDTTDIHPIFRIQNFDTNFLGEEDAQEAWRAMRPALALATKILTSSEARHGFWYHLSTGKPTIDEVTGKFYLAPVAHGEDDFSKIDVEFDAALSKLAQHINFFWMPPSVPASGGMETPAEGIFFGSMFDALEALEETIDSNYEWNIRWDLDDVLASNYLKGWRGNIGLSTKFLYHLISVGSDTRSKNWDWNSANLRLQFILAKAICHELSHAIWSLRCLTFEGNEFKGLDPYVFLSDAMPEVGNSFEAFFCREIIDLYPDDTGDRGLGRLVSRAPSRNHSFPNFFRVVDMQWVEAWFLKQTWMSGKPLFGTIPTGNGSSRSQYWTVDRWMNQYGETEEEQDESDGFQPVLYKDGRAVCSTYRRYRTQSDGLEPPEGVALEKWFESTLGIDTELALVSGFDPKLLQGSWGKYYDSTLDQRGRDES